MTEFEGQVLADLSVLKSQMQQLIGIGQPGRIAELEDRVGRHERSVQRMKGLVSAGGPCWPCSIWQLTIFDGR